MGRHSFWFACLRDFSSLAFPTGIRGRKAGSGGQTKEPGQRLCKHDRSGCPGVGTRTARTAEAGNSGPPAGRVPLQRKTEVIGEGPPGPEASLHRLPGSGMPQPASVPRTLPAALQPAPEPWHARGLDPQDPGRRNGSRVHDRAPAERVPGREPFTGRFETEGPDCPEVESARVRESPSGTLHLRRRDRNPPAPAPAAAGA